MILKNIYNSLLLKHFQLRKNMKETKDELDKIKDDTSKELKDELGKTKDKLNKTKDDTSENYTILMVLI